MNLMLHLGRRGREGLRDLKKDSFIERRDENGNLYVGLRYLEKEKMRQGAESDGINERDGRMYEQPGPHCPVQLLRNYLARLNDQSDAFFQRPARKPTHNHWFDNMPLGKQTLGNMLKNICKTVGLEKIYTNHCLRATTAVALARKGVERSAIKHVTGHRNESSLDPYLMQPQAAVRSGCSEILFNYAHDGDQVCNIIALLSFMLEAVSNMLAGYNDHQQGKFSSTSSTNTGSRTTGSARWNISSKATIIIEKYPF